MPNAKDNFQYYIILLCMTTLLSTPPSRFYSLGFCDTSFSSLSTYISCHYQWLFSRVPHPLQSALIFGAPTLVHCSILHTPLVSYNLSWSHQPILSNTLCNLPRVRLTCVVGKVQALKLDHMGPSHNVFITHQLRNIGQVTIVVPLFPLLQNDDK